MSNNYVVYMHISPSNKKYIGLTCQKPEKRWQNGKGYKYNEYFTRAIDKYGWDSFQHLIIAKGLTENEAKWLEIELIRVNDSTNLEKGYNITLGGEGTRGYQHTEETKQKYSEMRRGDRNPNYGKAMSEEQKQKISEAHKGSHHTEETRRKMSESHKGQYSGEKHPMYGKYGELSPMYGKKHTEEARRKMSESAKGRIVSEETKQKISKANKGENNYWYGKRSICAKGVICITTKRLFLSATEGANYYSIHYQNISKCCKGKAKSAGKRNGQKLIWKYLNYKHNKKFRKVQ